MYAAVIHTLHYCTPFVHCLWQSTATYSTATMIPPFRLLQADYPSTILRIRTIRFRRSLWRWLCWCPSINPWTPFDDSADTLGRFADTLWLFRGYLRRCRRKTADYWCGESVDFVKIPVTCTVQSCNNGYILSMGCRAVSVSLLHTTHLIL